VLVPFSDFFDHLVHRIYQGFVVVRGIDEHNGPSHSYLCKGLQESYEIQRIYLLEDVSP
jgi:hypothetical protein